MNKNLFKNIGKGILTFFVFYYSWIFQYIPVIIFNIDVTSISDSLNILLSAFSSIIVCFILLFMYRKELKEEFIKFKNNFSFNMDTGIKCWLAGLFCMMIFNIIISVIFKGGTAGNEETIQSMIGTLPWMMIISAGILAPWNEEIVFRKTLRNVFKNKYLFMITSGLVFGLAHVVGNVNTWTDWLFVLPYGSLGFAFALAYNKTDTIFTPMIFHMIHNISLVALSIYML